MGEQRLTTRTALRLDDYATKSEQEDQARQWSAHHLLDERRKIYPPTVILLGTGDQAVPIEQSKRFAEKLRSLGYFVREFMRKGRRMGSIRLTR